MHDLDTRVVYEFGEFQLDVAQRLLRSRADGQPVPLTSKVFETLLYLVEHRGELIEKTTLMQAIWPNVVVEENNLSQNISTLRRVLGERANEHRFIVTVPGRGNRFVAAVKTVTSPSPPATTPDSAAPASVVRRLRLAVLPFENLSPDPANAFFADGLHEEILSTLARRAPGMDVISRTTMMIYRLKPKPLLEVAKELAASHVMEGSVRREENKVRLTLQLIDAQNDRHLWSQNYDRTLTDALTLQSDVAGEVASQLSVQLVGGTQGLVPATRSPEAYDLVLKALLARYVLSPFASAERFSDFEGLLSRAIELDSSFGLAYAERATFRVVAFAWNYDSSEEQVRRIQEDLAAAQRLAPRDPIVLAAEASYWTWIDFDPPRALAMHREAELAGLADPMWQTSKSTLLYRIRRGDEAEQINERLLQLDPGNPFILRAAAAGLLGVRKTRDALRVVDRGLQLYPDDVALRFARALVVFAYSGRTEDWRAVLDRYHQTTPVTALLDQHFNLLRIECRFAELSRLLDGVSEISVRIIAGQGSSSFFGLGQRPMAQYRGWTALLLGNTEEAAKHGRAVLEFVAHQKETRRNAWFLRLLAAQGYAFIAERGQATTAGRKTLELMPPSADAFSWMAAATSTAMTFAWSGAHDEAVDLLEELSTSAPGPGPAWITRDPLFGVPLAQHPRYRALSDRLEAQMQDIDSERPA